MTVLHLLDPAAPILTFPLLRTGSTKKGTIIFVFKVVSNSALGQSAKQEGQTGKAKSRRGQVANAVTFCQYTTVAYTPAF